MNPEIGDYEILFHWSHLDWLFPNDPMKQEFDKQKYWKKAIPAAVKVDRNDNYYVSVPRWAPGIPATVNKIEMVDNKPMLSAYPSWEMNKIGDPNALQSVLGWEIDECNRAWFLDQGHIEGHPSCDGAQKIVCWDLTRNKLVESFEIPHEYASYQASFLNDLVVDNQNGFIYITDSGNLNDTQKLEGGLIVYNMRTGKFRRVLHQHISTQDAPDFRFCIAGKPVWKNRPMRTGADGIALAADRKTLYWCPLTGRNLYAIDTPILRDMSTNLNDIEKAVKDLGDKGTNTDGMEADNGGKIYYTMLEGQGIGIYDPVMRTFCPFVTDARMIWVDRLTFDNRGHIVFVNNRLHELFEEDEEDVDWNNEYNLIVWKAYVGDEVKSYLY